MTHIPKLFLAPLKWIFKEIKDFFQRRRHWKANEIVEFIKAGRTHNVSHIKIKDIEIDFSPEDQKE